VVWRRLPTASGALRHTPAHCHSCLPAQSHASRVRLLHPIMYCLCSASAFATPARMCVFCQPVLYGMLATLCTAQPRQDGGGKLACLSLDLTTSDLVFPAPLRPHGCRAVSCGQFCCYLALQPGIFTTTGYHNQDARHMSAGSAARLLNQVQHPSHAKGAISKCDS
jgi:hypothetical protein